MGTINLNQDYLNARQRNRRSLAGTAIGVDPAFTPPQTVPQQPAFRAMDTQAPQTPQDTQPPYNYLPNNYNYGDLAKYEEARRNQFGNTASADILKTRDSVASGLSDYAKKFYETQNPAILEDLNSRGLLTSESSRANAQAQALKEIELENSKYLRDFDTSALSARLQGQQDALDSGLDLRRGGLDQAAQDNASAREEALARDLAKKSQRNQLTNTLIGVGGSIGGTGLLPGGFLRGAAGAATAGTGTVAATGAGASGIPLASAASGPGIGAYALPVAGAAAGLGLYEESRKLLAKHGYGKNESKIVAATPLLSSPYIAAKELGKAVGKKGGDTTGIAEASNAIQGQLGQLRSLKAARDSGQITPQQYAEQSTPIVAAAGNNVSSAAGRGSKWASAVNPTWQAFQNEGFVQSKNGQWVSDTGVALYDPQRGWIA